MAFYLNGKEVTEEELMQGLHDMADTIMAEQHKTLEQYPGITPQCAGYIVYLRGRSRWTEAKELELVRRSRAGETLPDVLAGEF